MIVCTTIDEDGSVTVTIDTDGDQGDGYSTDITDDIVKRAGQAALDAYRAIHYPEVGALILPDESHDEE